MSITFYVSDWEKQETTEEKVFMDELYPNLDTEHWEMTAESDPYIKRDEESGRFYEIKTLYVDPFPEINMCNSNAYAIMRTLNLMVDSYGEITVEQISNVVRNAIAVLNSDERANQHTRLNEVTMRADAKSSTLKPRIISQGIDADYIRERMTQFIELLKFAKERNKSVYWA